MQSLNGVVGGWWFTLIELVFPLNSSDQLCFNEPKNTTILPVDKSYFSSLEFELKGGFSPSYVYKIPKLGAKKKLKELLK